MTFELDPEQLRALQLIKNKKNVFLTGGGGTGKSKVLEIFIEEYKKEYPEDWRNNLAITSTTGSSALLIKGTTIHSFSGIGVSREEEYALVQRLSKNRYLIKKWKALKILIIDEISMLTPRTFRLLYKLGQSIRKNASPFGGIQLILSGDFCQLAPILEQHILHHEMEFCFETPEWDASDIYVAHFKTIHRQNDKDFIETLQKIRMGISDQDTTSLLMERFRKDLNNPFGVEPVQLFPTREKANEINQKYYHKLRIMNQENRRYSLKINIDTRDVDNPMVNEINQQEIERKVRSQLPIDENIELCIGCQVILVINLSIEEGLVNGSKGKIEGFNENGEPIVIFSNGCIKNIAIYTWEINDGMYIVKAMGIPLILGYGCTIHRSQGMTLPLAVIDIGKNVFTGSGGYGQIYVALSRVKSLDGLNILNFDPTRIRCHPKVVEYYQTIDQRKDPSPSSHSVSTESDISLDSLSALEKPTKKKETKNKKNIPVENKGDIRSWLFKSK